MQQTFAKDQCVNENHCCRWRCPPEFHGHLTTFKENKEYCMIPRTRFNFIGGDINPLKMRLAAGVKNERLEVTTIWNFSTSCLQKHECPSQSHLWTLSINVYNKKDSVLRLQQAWLKISAQQEAETWKYSSFNWRESGFKRTFSMSRVTAGTTACSSAAAAQQYRRAAVHIWHLGLRLLINKEQSASWQTSYFSCVPPAAGANRTRACCSPTARFSISKEEI